MCLIVILKMKKKIIQLIIKLLKYAKPGKRKVDSFSYSNKKKKKNKSRSFKKYKKYPKLK